ncbi:MAG: hypothetical protein HKN76_09720 [Saprospiraceae bacterium]|nr:hypothetical protein [Saprospiraceae bacterium]
MASAQYHIRTQYIRASAAPGTEAPVSQSGNGFDLAAGYWFRLANRRIEFLPEVNYGKVSLPATEIDLESDLRHFGLALPVAVYPLDLEGDCKCPTFSKQNEWFKKGFFIELVPAYQRLQAMEANGDEVTWTNQINLGGGLGLDIGASDLITVTPLVHYFTYIYTSGSAANGAFVLKNQFKAVIRVMLRLDY